jgi:hypothetical protein
METLTFILPFFSHGELLLISQMRRMELLLFTLLGEEEWRR